MHNACSATRGRAPRPGAVGLQRASCMQADRHPSTSGQLSAGWQRLAGVAPTALLSGCGASAFWVSPVGGVVASAGLQREPQAGLLALSGGGVVRAKTQAQADGRSRSRQHRVARRPEPAVVDGLPGRRAGQPAEDPCAGRTLRGELALSFGHQSRISSLGLAVHRKSRCGRQTPSWRRGT